MENIEKGDLLNAHKHSFSNKDEILESAVCGCFHCKKIFRPNEITAWIEEISENMETAKCPFCGIDSVVGDKSGYPLTIDFLKSMHNAFF